MRLIFVALALGLLASGGICAQKQAPPESIETVQSVFGDIYDLLWQRNDVYWHSGDYNRCIANMRLITRINPHDTEAYEDTAWLMFSVLRDEDSEAFLREGLANNPDVYEMYYELANFCYYRTRFDEAIVLYTAAVGFPETPLFVRHMLAHAYEHSGAIGDALETWLEAEAIEPDNPVTSMNIQRIMEGGAPSGLPESIARSIKHRIDKKANDGAEESH